MRGRLARLVHAGARELMRAGWVGGVQMRWGGQDSVCLCANALGRPGQCLPVCQCAGEARTVFACVPMRWEGQDSVCLCANALGRPGQ
eukprot:365028-Chlamydomonas_euryale.AAC.1